MKYRKITLAVVTVALIFGLTSCQQLLVSLFGTTIEEQISAFQATLNTDDRSDILDHIHPDMANYQQLADPQTFIDSPLYYGYQPFTFGPPTVDKNNVAVCSFLNDVATGTITFTMALDGYDYKILKLNITLDTGAGWTIESLLTRPVAY